jgi:hypothetical protein
MLIRRALGRTSEAELKEALEIFLLASLGNRCCTRRAGSFEGSALFDTAS